MEPTSSRSGPIRPSEPTAPGKQSKGSKASKKPIGGEKIFGEAGKALNKELKGKLKKGSEKHPGVSTAASKAGVPPGTEGKSSRHSPPQVSVAQSSSGSRIQVEEEEPDKLKLRSLFNELVHVIGSADKATNMGLFEMMKAISKQTLPFSKQEIVILNEFRNILKDRQEVIKKELKEEGIENKFDKLFEKLNSIGKKSKTLPTKFTKDEEKPFAASSSGDSLELEPRESRESSSRDSLSEDWEVVEEDLTLHQNISECMTLWEVNNKKGLKSLLRMESDGILRCVPLPPKHELTNKEIFEQFQVGKKLVKKGIRDADKKELIPFIRLINENFEKINNEIQIKFASDPKKAKKEQDHLFILRAALR